MRIDIAEMYIIPFYTRTKSGEITKSIELTVAWIFMKENGKKIWKTEGSSDSVEEIVKEYMNENGFYGTVKEVLGNTIYFQVDTEKTQVNDYYRWLDDVDETTDIWRPWFFFTGSNMEFPDQIKVLRDRVLKL
jgi:hypothetical protein